MSLPGADGIRHPDAWPHLADPRSRGRLHRRRRSDRAAVRDLPRPDRHAVRGAHRGPHRAATDCTSSAPRSRRSWTVRRSACWRSTTTSPARDHAAQRRLGRHRQRRRCSRNIRAIGVGTWLLQHAAAWLRLGGSRNLISYVGDDEIDSALHGWHMANGFEELNRTRRGWSRTPAHRVTPHFATHVAASSVVMAALVRIRISGSAINPSRPAASRCTGYARRRPPPAWRRCSAEPCSAIRAYRRHQPERWRC